MADYMGALTWQAAWLRYHHEWNRVVVGYALTDIPERVLEVYGIPTTDKAVMERTMRSLREQPGYRELIQCCDQDQRAEELLRLAAALENLPDDQREAVTRRYLRGDALPAIASELGKTTAAVAGLLQRGLRNLREVLPPLE